MKKLILICSISLLSGCSTIEKVRDYWPRSHDPVMFDNLIKLEMSVEKQNCESPNWGDSHNQADHLARYTEARRDPQANNIRGLEKHLDRLNQGGSKGFCEIGKKLAQQRIQIAKGAWKGR